MLRRLGLLSIAVPLVMKLVRSRRARDQQRY
jgi:hypothetical protein